MTKADSYGTKRQAKALVTAMVTMTATTTTRTTTTVMTTADLRSDKEKTMAKAKYRDLSTALLTMRL